MYRPKSFLTSSAYPLDLSEKFDSSSIGLTKLELSSLMIAQGLAANNLYRLSKAEDQDFIVKLSVQMAARVLLEAQKTQDL
jgi:hypothetical protein